MQIRFGRFFRAIKDFSMALKINPSDYCGFLGRGCAKRDLNDHQGAIEDFTGALKLDSQSFVPYFYRGFSRAILNDHQAAIEDYTNYLKQDLEEKMLLSIEVYLDLI